MSDTPTNILRDADGRVLYEGDKPPPGYEDTPRGRDWAASRSPWRTAGEQFTEDDLPADLGLEADYRQAYGWLDGNLGNEGYR